jgi:ankyrin repeat domain-containing protein 13
LNPVKIANQIKGNLNFQESEQEVEDEVDLLMSSDIIAVQMSTKSISFSRAQSGWFFKEDRKELVGPFSSEFYNVNGMVLESRKRREHLTEEDLRKNKAIVESFTKGGGTSQVDVNGEVKLKL